MAQSAYLFQQRNFLSFYSHSLLTSLMLLLVSFPIIIGSCYSFSHVVWYFMNALTQDADEEDFDGEDDDEEVNEPVLDSQWIYLAFLYNYTFYFRLYCPSSPLYPTTFSDCL